MPLRERDTSTVQAAADAFLSSPRYANPNTRRGYTGVLDRLLVGLGAGRPLAEGTPLLPPLDLPESVKAIAVHGNVIATVAGADIAVHQPALPRPTL